jgi:hypothetical protein
MRAVNRTRRQVEIRRVRLLLQFNHGNSLNLFVDAFSDHTGSLGFTSYQQRTQFTRAAKRSRQTITIPAAAEHDHASHVFAALVARC